MLIHHQRLGLCYSDWKKESSLVSIWVKWDSLLLNTFSYHQGLEVSTLDSFLGLSGLSWTQQCYWLHRWFSLGRKLYLKVFGDANFLNPLRGLQKLCVPLSVNNASSTVFIYYHLYWSIFICICSKGHDEKGQQALKEDRKKKAEI